MEPLELTWNDVLWAEGKIRVRSPKTRHHAGKEMRYVPIRDVLKYLEDAHAVAQDGDGRIITRYSRSMSNLHKPFERIIENAGYQPWPNLIKNLRLSCENDWIDASEAPAHVIAAWIGHDIEVQTKSYAIISDGHFEQFNARTQDGSKSGIPGGTEPVRIDENSDETEAPPRIPPIDKTQETNKKARSEDRAECSGEDSNLHGVTPTCPSSMRVYQFHHQSDKRSMRSSTRRYERTT